MRFQSVLSSLLALLVLLDNHWWIHPRIAVMTRLCTEFLVDTTPLDRLHPFLIQWMPLMLLRLLDHPIRNHGLSEYWWDNFCVLRMLLVQHMGFAGLDLWMVQLVALILLAFDLYLRRREISPNVIPWIHHIDEVYLDCIQHQLVWQVVGIFHNFWHVILFHFQLIVNSNTYFPVGRTTFILFCFCLCFSFCFAV